MFSIGLLFYWDIPKWLHDARFRASSLIQVQGKQRSGIASYFQVVWRWNCFSDTLPKGELPWFACFVNNFRFRTTRSSNCCLAFKPSHSRWTKHLEVTWVYMDELHSMVRNLKSRFSPRYSFFPEYAQKINIHYRWMQVFIFLQCSHHYFLLAILLSSRSCLFEWFVCLLDLLATFKKINL